MNLIRFALVLLSAFPLFSTLLLGYQLFRNGQGAMGKPAIVPWLFFSAKITVAVLFAVLLAASLKPGLFLWFPWLIQNEVPAVQQLMSVLLLLAGNLFLIPAYFTMSIFTRVGLPNSPHVIKTGGIYRVTRNPMYLSFWFFFTACFLLVPSMLIAAPAFFCTVIHHFIILSEEQYMTGHFNDQYSDYRRHVPRYL